MIHNNFYGAQVNIRIELGAEITVVEVSHAEHRISPKLAPIYIGTVVNWTSEKRVDCYSTVVTTFVFVPTHFYVKSD